MFHPKVSLKSSRTLAGLMVAALTVSACITNTPPQFSKDSAYPEARYQELADLRTYRICRDHALTLDQEARTQRDSAKYLASARMIVSCDAKLGNAAPDLAQKERMQAYALSIQNHLKGGDVATARTALETFKTTYRGDDLYFADGSSFVETMDVLFGLKSTSALSRYSDANVNTALKAELRRVPHWAKH